MRTVYTRVRTRQRALRARAPELPVYRGLSARKTEASRHRLDVILFMVVLLAHSIGVGFSNVVEASEPLLAGRHRPPGQLLYGQRSREFLTLAQPGKLRTMRARPARDASDVILLCGVANGDKIIGSCFEFQSRK